MVYILLAPGVEEMEAVVPGDLLRRAGIPAAYVSVGRQEVCGAHSIRLMADLTIDQMDLTQMDMVVLPGGKAGVEALSANSQVLDAVKFAAENGKWIGAICAAPAILAKLHITDGKRVVCYPDSQWVSAMEGATVDPVAPAVTDGRVITGASAGCAVAFGLALVTALRGQELARSVAEGIVIR